MPYSTLPVQSKHEQAQFILVEHPSCKITSEYITANYRPLYMQIITLSIIYRELWVYTVLYRASNTEDKSSEWGNLNSREFSWNDMVGWQKNKMKFVCRQLKKEKRENKTYAIQKSKWKWVTRMRTGPTQNWGQSKHFYFSHLPTPLPTLLYHFTMLYSRLCFYTYFSFFTQTHVQ